MAPLEGAVPATSVSHEDRCIGCLLGTACGDILGAAVEGWPASDIRQQFGQVWDFTDSGRGFGCYTDDTQMTLALATSLVECGAVDAAHVSAKYAEFYEPWRGYGSVAHRVMRVLADGGDYPHHGVTPCGPCRCGLYQVDDQKLVAVHATYRFQTAADLAHLVERPMPQPFHTGHLADSLRVNRWSAQRIAYCFRQTGAVREVGKQGNALLYEFADAKKAG